MSGLILVLNSGSSSLKFSVVDHSADRAVFEGLAEQLGVEAAKITFKSATGQREPQTMPGIDHHQALVAVFDKLSERKLMQDIIAIGHRVVHGGEFFNQPTLITEEVIAKIRACEPLAPLHNPAHLIGILDAWEACPNLPQVAVFDTAFHQTMPPKAFLYAVPIALYEQHGVRRYGFHGTSHEYVSGETIKRLQLDPEDSGVIVAHLGNGASVCAVANGKSMDTSMGLTPLEGLVMGTRSGDIDAGVLQYLHNTCGMSLEDIMDMLNKRSGLLGLSNQSNDMRSLCELASTGDAAATTAIEVFCYRLAKYIAAYSVALERLDAIVFTGGIGENARPVRARVAALLKNLGVSLSDELNQENGDPRGVISNPQSRIPLLVIPTQEELMIARATFSSI